MVIPGLVPGIFLGRGDRGRKEVREEGREGGREKKEEREISLGAA